MFLKNGSDLYCNQMGWEFATYIIKTYYGTIGLMEWEFATEPPGIQIRLHGPFPLEFNDYVYRVVCRLACVEISVQECPCDLLQAIFSTGVRCKCPFLYCGIKYKTAASLSLATILTKWRNEPCECLVAKGQGAWRCHLRGPSRVLP